MGVQPLRHRLQLTTDLVLGEKIEYAALDGAFLALVGSGGCAFVLRISGLMLKFT
uniref:ISRm17 transposase n=1 Tax=Rhizobium meliloti TaxID=382 RepID=I2E1P7_RHIML|nr:ISRm17 transposase [Sinorhizobium meliloti]